MTDSIIGQIDFFPFSQVPVTHLVCDGAILPIKDNESLFKVIGNAFGGNGKSNFALPDLRGRAVVGSGTYPDTKGKVWQWGAVAGRSNETLDINQCPSHSHTLSVPLVAPDSIAPTGAFAGFSKSINFATPVTAGVGVLNENFIGNSGQSRPHTNMQPFLALQACICSEGIEPAF